MCQPGFGCLPGSAMPLECSPGEAQSKAMRASCVSCEAGKYSTRSTIACQNCAPGRHSAASCLDILAGDREAESGIYHISSPDGSGTIPVWCDMGTQATSCAMIKEKHPNASSGVRLRPHKETASESASPATLRS